MSTKIYYAYEYKGSLLDLRADLYSLRNDLVSFFVDDYKDPNKYTNWLDVNKQLRKSFKELFEASVVVYPYRDEYNKKLLVQFFGYLWDDYIDNYKKFTDFHYQDQSDRPENISEKEWEYREEVWGKVFDKYATPELDGFTFVLLNASMAFHVSQEVDKKMKEIKC